jgi:hypothetical protein
VAEVRQQARLGTVLLDLLTEPEEMIDSTTAEFLFDIALFVDRSSGARLLL